MINWWSTEFGQDEIIKITESISKKQISQGEVTKEFEDKLSKYLDVKYVIACSSGSSSLLMSLLAIGIKPNDEVIIPNRTWIATAHAIQLLGAKVIPIDVEEHIPLINVNKIEVAITKNTKAIIAVHMNGRDGQITSIKKIARKYNLNVIEDAAQAIGSKNQYGMLGTQSDIGCFSLSTAKTIASGQGGFSVTNNKMLAKRLYAIRTHGVEQVKDPKKWNMLGFNFRYTDILASIAIVQLSKIESRIKHLKEIYLIYEKELRNTHLKNIPVDISKGEVPVYIEYLVPSKRQHWINYLNSKNIDTRPFYPNVSSASYLHTSMQKKLNSSLFEKKGIYLPSGPTQSKENVYSCIKAIKEYI